MGCFYQELAKCKNCSYLTYSQCKEFRKWRVKHLIRDVLPLTLMANDLDYHGTLGKVYFSNDSTSARKHAACTAIHYNKFLKKITLNQAITIALESQEITHKIYIIECTKSAGEREKLQSCFESCIDRMLMSGCYVMVLLKGNVISSNPEWIKLKQLTND